MTTFDPRDFPLNRPGKLIAALPAVLGFVPEKSLVLVTLEDGETGLRDARRPLRRRAPMRWSRWPTVAAASRPERRHRGDRRRGRRVVPDVQRRPPRARRASRRGPASAHGIELLGGPRRGPVAAGGRWHCADGCGAAARSTIPRRHRWPRPRCWTGGGSTRSRAELLEVIAVTDPDRTAALSGGHRDVASHDGAAPPGRRRAARRRARDGRGRRASPKDGARPTDDDIARLACGVDRSAGSRHALRARRRQHSRTGRGAVGAAGAGASGAVARRSACAACRSRPTRGATGRWRGSRWRRRCAAIPKHGWRACSIRRCRRVCGQNRSGSWRAPATGLAKRSGCNCRRDGLFGRRAG